MFSFSRFVLLLLLLLLRSSAVGRTRPTPPPFPHPPASVDSRPPLVEKEHFSPAPSMGPETLPEPVLEVPFPVRPSTSPPSSSGVSVDVSCNVRDLQVKLQKSVLGGREMESQVKLGTCQSSKSTEEHLYFEYGSNLCGTVRQLINNQVIYRNTLHYAPRIQRPTRQTAPFSLPVECYYNRTRNSYKTRHTLKMWMRKFFKPTRSKAKFILTLRNAQWEKLSPSHQYVLGKPMYFEAEALSMSKDKRLYVHSCYVTPEESPTSTPQVPIVTNFGCVLKGRGSRSRFIPYKPNIVRFTVNAFVFAGMTDQLFMHCYMSVNSSTPTPTSKSCNYNRKAKRWVELQGSDAVCSCCDSNCSSAASTATVTISSRLWTADLNVKHTSKRKMVSPTTTRAEATQTGSELAERRTTSLPFGGGGAPLVDMEGQEKQVKGSAVVEAEAPPRVIFEEIFQFD